MLRMDLGPLEEQQAVPSTSNLFSPFSLCNFVWGWFSLWLYMSMSMQYVIYVVYIIEKGSGRYAQSRRATYIHINEVAY